MGAVLVGFAFAYDLQRIHHLAPLIALLVNISIQINLNLQPLGEGVYNGCANAVEAAGYLVAAVAELSACVKDGKHHLNRGQTRFFLYANRASAAVVDYGDGIVLLDGHFNGITISRQCLVHRIIYNLIYQMMKTSGACTADVHARPFSDGLKPLQNLNLICSVLLSHASIFLSCSWRDQFSLTTAPSMTLNILSILNRLFTKSSNPVQVMMV